ncbi:MAG: lamin tail domain-containing protein [Patescibacteria group bacterium]|nr:lamin tail domain-containing protein [Patescibacteria group bacterium]MDW8279629.1 lamin tail domain-containing protein [bacterium]
MIQINEWLPNPIGKDSKNEWIEIYNNSNQKINLNNWTIVSGTKSYKIKNKAIEPYSFLVLYQKETKLNLLNKNGELKLFDNQGNLIDQINFFGKAPDGQSFSRFDKKWMFTEPTPYKINQKNNFQMAQIINNKYPENIPLNKIENYNFILIGTLIAILLSLIFWYIIKNNDDLKNIFFK